MNRQLDPMDPEREVVLKPRLRPQQDNSGTHEDSKSKEDNSYQNRSGLSFFFVY